MASASVIRAAVSSKILNKVDRFFSNRLSGIFIELVQNARRAGASEIAVSTETTSEGTRIVFEDNGAGIDDFSKLLHLGDSNWDAETARSEDPAGMGFFSLIHTGVTVYSNSRRADISTAAFLGQRGCQYRTHGCWPGSRHPNCVHPRRKPRDRRAGAHRDRSLRLR